MQLHNVPAGADSSRSGGNFLKGFAEDFSGLVFLGMLPAGAGSLGRHPGPLRPGEAGGEQDGWEDVGAWVGSPGRSGRGLLPLSGDHRAWDRLCSLAWAAVPSTCPSAELVQRFTNTRHSLIVRGHWASRLRPGAKPMEGRGSLLNFEQNSILSVNIDFN